MLVAHETKKRRVPDIFVRVSFSGVSEDGGLCGRRTGTEDTYDHVDFMRRMGQLGRYDMM